MTSDIWQSIAYTFLKQWFFSAQAQMLISEIQISHKLALPNVTKRLLKCLSGIVYNNYNSIHSSISEYHRRTTRSTRLCWNRCHQGVLGRGGDQRRSPVEHQTQQDRVLRVHRLRWHVGFWMLGMIRSTEVIFPSPRALLVLKGRCGDRPYQKPWRIYHPLAHPHGIMEHYVRKFPYLEVIGKLVPNFHHTIAGF